MKTKTSTFAAFILKVVFLLTAPCLDLWALPNVMHNVLQAGVSRYQLNIFFTVGGAQTIDKQFSETQMATPG